MILSGALLKSISDEALCPRGLILTMIIVSGVLWGIMVYQYAGFYPEKEKNQELAIIVSGVLRCHYDNFFNCQKLEKLEKEK